MTTEQIAILKLGIAPIDERTTLIVESALEWVNKNTTLKIDMDNDNDLRALPPCVRLFIIEFIDINMLRAGVSSESIEGMSQSYGTTDKSTLIWQAAENYLSDFLNSRVSFVSAKRIWN